MNILVTCPSCAGRSQVPARHLLLAVGPGQPAQHAGGTVAWICRSCVDLVAAKVDQLAVATLVAGGTTPIAYGTERPRPVHPETAVGGDPLTTNDLLELHQLLSSDSWFDQLSSQPDGGTAEPAKAESLPPSSQPEKEGH